MFNMYVKLLEANIGHKSTKKRVQHGNASWHRFLMDSVGVLGANQQIHRTFLILKHILRVHLQSYAKGWV